MNRSGRSLRAPARSRASAVDRRRAMPARWRARLFSSGNNAKTRRSSRLSRPRRDGGSLRRSERRRHRGLRARSRFRGARCDASEVRTCRSPSTRTTPLCATRPRIARSVVVLPTPLRPSSAVTLPMGTFMEMPLSTCEPAMVTCRSLISSGVGHRGSTEIRRLDLSLARPPRVRAASEQSARSPGRRGSGEADHDGHVVLDHQDGTTFAVQAAMRSVNPARLRC